jgi:hypothetical protein
MTVHHAPVQCPACASTLQVTELTCEACGTRVAGHFAHCEFCALDDDQRALLRVFLSSRGNMKELERHLGVSYPTARARLLELLAALGMAGEEPEPRLAMLEALARGEIDVEQALTDLGE